VRAFRGSLRQRQGQPLRLRGALVLSGDSAREALLAGADVVADAVAPTLGPQGRHVVLERLDAPPLVTNDGVTIARAVEKLEDPVANQGIHLLRQASEAAELEVGDGTTTATIIARSLLRAAFARVGAGEEPVAMAREIDDQLTVVADWLRERAVPLAPGREAIEQVARLASRDEEIASLVAEAVERVGVDGVVRVEDSSAYGLHIDFIEGMRFPNGLVSPALAVDREGGQTVFDRPLLLLVSGRLTLISQLRPVLEAAASARRPVVIVADEISGDALTMLAMNVAKRTIPVAAVKAPEFGPDRAAALRDIAAWSGGTLFGEELGRLVEGAGIEELGQVERAVVTADSTTLEGGAGLAGEVADRLTRIDAELVRTDSEYERTKLRTRRARLGGAVAVIGVGCDSEVEQEEVRLRVVDAVQASRAAVRSGLVPGGGGALVQAAALSGVAGSAGVAGPVVERALQEPARQLAENAGLDPSVAVRELREMSFGRGVDLSTGSEVDLLARGIADPVEVTCAALVAAGSVARMGLLCDFIVARKPLPRVRRDHHSHGHHYHGDPEGIETQPAA
jgi:chaperonin GroEL